MTCPHERFPTLTAAQQAILQRRARATLSGSPHPDDRIARDCDRCGGAHITRAEQPAPMDSRG